MQLNNVSKELLEIKDSSSVLRRRLAEMMNSLLSDLVSVNVDTSKSRDFRGSPLLFEFSYLRWVDMCGTFSSCGVFITNKRFICFSSSRAKLVTLSEETRLK